MSILRDISQVNNGRLESTDSRVGVLASEIPTGFSVPSFLLNDIDADKPDRLYAIKFTSTPSDGEFFANKDGTGFFRGAQIGKYTGTQLVEKYDYGVGLVSRVAGTYEINVIDPASDTTPVVTGVVVSPDGATGSQKFNALVLGKNNPSQNVFWSIVGPGTLDDTGNFIEPPRTNQVQVIAITATSYANTAFHHTVNVVIPALVIIDETPADPVPLPSPIENNTNDVMVSSFVFSDGAFRNKDVKLLTKLHVQDRRTTGAPGQRVKGGSSATAVKREMNTVLRNTIVGCVVYNNKITLPVGSYRINVIASGGDAISQLKVMDTTNNRILAYSANSNPSILGADFTIVTHNTDIEIQQLSKHSNGVTFTFPPNNGFIEIYLDVIIEKVK